MYDKYKNCEEENSNGTKNNTDKEKNVSNYDNKNIDVSLNVKNDIRKFFTYM